MSITLKHENGNIYRVDIAGRLRSSDLADCQRTLADEMSRVGAVRLLVLLERFEGWETRDDWGDLSFFVKHGDGVERMAIVGDEQWRGGSLIFAGTDLRRADVEFFPREGLATARDWLSRRLDGEREDAPV